MNLRFASLCAASALGYLLSACKDSTTTPAAQAAGPRPSLATVSDTGGGGGGPGNQSHFVANGNAGSVNWFVSGGSGSPSDSGGGGGGGGGFIFGSLGVSRGGPTNSPQTFLSYFIEQCDPFVGCTFLGGSGLIPNGDLSGGGQQLRLATNTSGNPTFFTFGGSAGLVAVDWRANGAFQQRSSGTTDLIFPGFRQHFTGVSTSSSANAAGSVVGVPVPPASPGSIGTNQNVTIDISR